MGDRFDRRLGQQAHIIGRVWPGGVRIMTIKRKLSDPRELDLQLALVRIQRGPAASW